MKKSVLFILFILGLCAIGCTDDEPDVVKPVPAFSQDKFIIEAGDAVSFTDNSIDAASYLWDFGDGNSSTFANPRHTYADTGNYVVRLTITSEAGSKVATTSEVKVGRRFAVAFLIWNAQFNKENGDPWDPGADGPDLIFSYGASAEDEPEQIDMGFGFTRELLPFGGFFPPNNQRFLTDEEWTFELKDNDEPFINLRASESMKVFQLNPVTVASEVDNIEGQGSFQMTNGDYFFEILFLIE